MQSPADQEFIKRAVEAAVRIAIVAGLVFWAFRILAPFLSVLIWAGIIAVAVFPAYQSLVKKMGGRRDWAATVVVIIGLSLVILPSMMLTESLLESAQNLREQIESGSLEIPDASPEVREWPLVGERIYDFWVLSKTNMQEAMARVQPQLQQLGRTVVQGVAGAGRGLIQFILSIIIAGVMLAKSEAGTALIRKVFVRIALGRGAGFAQLAEQIIRGVALGIVGVAFVQAILAGIAFIIVDLPGAALWALLILMLGVVQLPTLIAMVPIVIWAIGNLEPLPAILFCGFSVVVALLDNILKPIFMGRNVDAPTLVVFLGAIGGFISIGFIGLFIGAITLVLAYEILIDWIGEQSDIQAKDAVPVTSTDQSPG